MTRNERIDMVARQRLLEKRFRETVLSMQAAQAVQAPGETIVNRNVNQVHPTPVRNVNQVNVDTAALVEANRDLVENITQTSLHLTDVLAEAVQQLRDAVEALATAERRRDDTLRELLQELLGRSPVIKLPKLPIEVRMPDSLPLVVAKRRLKITHGDGTETFLEEQ